MSMVDEQQRRLVNAAARKFADALRESYRMAAGRAVLSYGADLGQELGIELVQSFFDNVINELSIQVGGVRRTTQELINQQRRQQATMQTLAGESVEAYMNLIHCMFSSYGGAEAGRNAGE